MRNTARLLYFFEIYDEHNSMTIPKTVVITSSADGLISFRFRYFQNRFTTIYNPLFYNESVMVPNFIYGYESASEIRPVSVKSFQQGLEISHSISLVQS